MQQTTGEHEEETPSELSPLVAGVDRKTKRHRLLSTDVRPRFIGGGILFLIMTIACVFHAPAALSRPDMLTAVFAVVGPIVGTTSIKVAFAGNSMMYYSDLPRLMEHMLHTRFDHVVQDSCFQGLSSISSLWTIGNTVSKTFHTKAAKKPDGTYDIGARSVQELLQEQNDWDFLILNDFTQSPARLETREESKAALEKYYAPVLREKGITLILLTTAAYEYPMIHNTSDLGDFDEFTSRLYKGYVVYQDVMSKLNCLTRLAPNALAFSYVRYQQQELFHKLYAPDHHHPSPHGTWMEACVLYCTMLDEMPPKYNVNWWSTARYLVPGLPLPSEEEAEEIRQIAWYVCKIY